MLAGGTNTQTHALNRDYFCYICGLSDDNHARELKQKQKGRKPHQSFSSCTWCDAPFRCAQKPPSYCEDHMTSSACAQLDVISGQPVLLAYKRKVDRAICLLFLLFTAACIVGYFSLTYILRGQGEISLLCPTYCMQEQPRSCNL